MTPDARRLAAAHHEQGSEMRERQACSLIGADRSSMRYRHHRLHVLLRRDGQAPCLVPPSPGGDPAAKPPATAARTGTTPGDSIGTAMALSGKGIGGQPSRPGPKV